MPDADEEHQQSLNGRWELAPSLDEGWRFRGLHRDDPQPVGAFARSAWIPAQVPGGVHADLLRAGLIPDFRQNLNSLAAEWVTARAWVYRRRFRADLPPGGRLWLRLDGLDWSGQVFLNGEALGRVEGAHTLTRLRLPDLDRDAEHLLVIVLGPPPPEAGQLGRTSETHSLKARYGYWWDFGTRLVQVGLTQPIRLEWDAGAALLDVVPDIELSEDLRRATVRPDLTHDGAAGLDLTATLTHPDGRRECVYGRLEELRFDLDAPQLWWPRGMGEQPLYGLEVELDGSAPVSCRFGLRNVRLVHNAASRARGALPYTLEVNGAALYARGFNVLPVDMAAGLPGEAERQRAVIELAERAYANLLRFNGVAPLAPRTMLDACDELGLLVWQELPLTSSSTDSVPPELEGFRDVLDAGLPPLLRRLRSHPSVVLLGAGNELTDEARRPVGLDHPTIAHIAGLVRAAGLSQPFLPTSPSGPSYDLSPDAEPAAQHDIHGAWHYRGARDSYGLHARSRALFHSEFGCQAPARERSLRRYLPQSPLWPMDDTRPEIAHHGEWWLMRHRVEEVFGPLSDLRTYLLLAQAAQGDVLRHALGWNRARAGECSGALVWQLNEPWPNAHGTSLLDYDLAPKLAYYRCREANAPLALHWGLERPVAAETLTLCPQVLADGPGEGSLELNAHGLNGGMVWSHAQETDWPAVAEPLSLPLSDTPLLLRGRVLDRAGREVALSEQWVARDRPHPFAALTGLPRTELRAELDGSTLRLTNVGPVVAPWLSLETLGDGLELFEDNGFSLLPGETRRVGVELRSLAGEPLPFTLSVQALNVPPFRLAVSL